MGPIDPAALTLSNVTTFVTARAAHLSADRIIQLRALALSDRRGDAIDLTLEHLRREARAA